MPISQVIEFNGSPDDLIWKYPNEEFNTTSQLIVDETYQAQLIINGQAADLFRGAREIRMSHFLPEPYCKNPHRRGQPVQMQDFLHQPSPSDGPALGHPRRDRA